MPRSTAIALVKTYGVLIACFPFIGCHSPQAQVAPSIEFTTLPPSAEGDGSVFVSIAGRVTGARPGQQIVVCTQGNLVGAASRGQAFHRGSAGFQLEEFDSSR